MAFERLSDVTPEAIGNITVVLEDPDPTGPGSQRARFVVVVKNSDGTVKRLDGNLAPHLTAQQISTVQSFLTAIRNKAIGEILP